MNDLLLRYRYWRKVLVDEFWTFYNGINSKWKITSGIYLLISGMFLSVSDICKAGAEMTVIKRHWEICRYLAWLLMLMYLILCLRQWILIISIRAYVYAYIIFALIYFNATESKFSRKRIRNITVNCIHYYNYIIDCSDRTSIIY